MSDDSFENTLKGNEIIEALRVEVDRLKDEDAFSQTVIAEQGRKIDDLTQQLAAANGRGAELCKVARALDMAANHSVLEELPEVMREASKRIFAAVNGNGKTGAQMLDAALSDLPEADKEKS